MQTSRKRDIWRVQAFSILSSWRKSYVKIMQNSSAAIVFGVYDDVEQFK